MDGIQMEVDTGKFRKMRRAGTTRPVGDWPYHWSGCIHVFDGHGIDAFPEDRIGEELLMSGLNSLYFQCGVESAYDDVSGAALDPALVRAGRDVEMGFFKDMGVYERVPRMEQVETGGKVIGTK